LNGLYLLDASVTETNAVKLKLLNDSGEIEELVDTSYKPYFLAPYPLSKEDQAIADGFSGKTQIVQKNDIFSGQILEMTEIRWPNPAIALKAARKLSQCWESEIALAKSYVYDKALVFGALHHRDGLKLAPASRSGAAGRFENAFKDAKTMDPLKYAQISYWSTIIEQPIPNAEPNLLGVGKADAERVPMGWMLSRIANIPLPESLTSKHVSHWIKSIIYTYLRKNNFLIPTPEELRRGKQPHRVTGALTVSPIAGTYFNTVVCDFESLYASCIDSFNLSYETVDCNHDECRRSKIPDLDHHACIKRRGFYSILIGALKELRIKLFKPTTKDSSATEEERRIAVAAAKLLKLLAVSSYGVTVRIHGLACPPLAEAITSYGRYVLRESWKMAETNGLRPLYGDTDSLFLDGASDGQIAWLIAAVRTRFHLDLAIDKRYSLCILPKAKKAYLGILADGTPDIKGVTAIKSNSAGYTSKVFLRCANAIGQVKSHEEYERAKETIRGIVRSAIDDLQNKRVKLEDLKYNVKLYFDPNEKTLDMKTSPQPYQTALQLIQSGKRLRQGDTISFVKVKPFKFGNRIFTVKPSELVRNISEINAGDYIRNLLTALNQAFEPMGVKLEAERKADISKWLT